MTVALANVTFDCRDAAALAGFWSAATGRPVDDGATSEFASIGLPAEDGRPAWLFNQVPESKTAKNRVHLDVNAGHGATDRRAAVRSHMSRLVAAGATVLREMQEESGWWIVMADPEGNEFCLQ